MSDLTLQHPVTGAEKTVGSGDAERYLEAGWIDATSTSRRGHQADKPDVKAGREALAAENGQPVFKSPKRAAAAKKATAPQAAEQNQEGEKA